MLVAWKSAVLSRGLSSACVPCKPISYLQMDHRLSVHFMLKKSLIIIARIHTLPFPGAGTFPATDHCGQPWRDPWRSSRAGKALAGPYIGVLEGIEGDQDFIRLCFQLQRHAARQSCCYFCRARDVQTSVRFIGFKRPTQVNKAWDLHCHPHVLGP